MMPYGVTVWLWATIPRWPQNPRRSDEASCLRYDKVKCMLNHECTLGIAHAIAVEFRVEGGRRGEVFVKAGVSRSSDAQPKKH